MGTYRQGVPSDDYRSLRIMQYIEQNFDDIKIFACAGQGGNLMWSFVYLYASYCTEEFEGNTYVSLWSTSFWKQLSSGLDPATREGVGLIVRDYESYSEAFCRAVEGDMQTCEQNFVAH
jgi:hypothetical protein